MPKPTTRPAPAARPTYNTLQLDGILRTISRLAADNLENETTGAVKFSRACAKCSRDSTEDRHAALACGHVFCSDCTEGRISCPECYKETAFLRLFEQGSRECQICLIAEPMKRGFFSGCGHILCDACIGKMWYEALMHRTRFACVHCQTKSRPIKLKEQPEAAPPVAAVPLPMIPANCRMEAHAVTEEGRRPRKRTYTEL